MVFSDTLGRLVVVYYEVEAIASSHQLEVNGLYDLQSLLSLFSIRHFLVPLFLKTLSFDNIQCQKEFMILERRFHLIAEIFILYEFIANLNFTYNRNYETRTADLCSVVGSLAKTIFIISIFQLLYYLLKLFYLCLVSVLLKTPLNLRLTSIQCKKVAYRTLALFWSRCFEPMTSKHI